MSVAGKGAARLIAPPDATSGSGNARKPDEDPSGLGTRSPVIVERPAFHPRHESAWRRMGLTKPSLSSPRTGRGGFLEDSTKHLLRGPVPEIPLPADGRLVTPLSPAPGDVVVGAPAGAAGAGVAFTPKRPAGGRAHGDRRGGHRPCRSGRTRLSLSGGRSVRRRLARRRRAMSGSPPGQRRS